MPDAPQRVLVIEGDPAHREAIRCVLEEGPGFFTCHSARSLAEARSRIALGTFDLILADAYLPDGSPLDLLEGEREDGPAIAMVVMSNRGDEQLAVQALKAGALDYLVKSPEAFEALPRVLGRVHREWQHILARRGAERALSQSERRLRTLASLNSDFLFACHHEGQGFREREWITEAFFRITGFTPEDLEEKGCWLFCVHPEDRPSVETAFGALLPGQKDTREFRILTRGGQVRWVRSNVEIQASEPGSRIQRRLGSVKDITESKAALDELVLNRAELKAVYDQAPVMLCVLNSELRVVFANQSFLDFSKKPEEEVLAHRICGILGCAGILESPDGGKADACIRCDLLRALETTLQTGAAIRNLEHRMEVQEGERPEKVVLLGTTCMIAGPSGPQLLLCLQDISELKRAEAARMEAEQQYRTIIEASPTAILLVQDGRYTFANPAAASLLGFASPKDLEGHSVEETVVPADLARIRSRLARIQAGRPLEIQVIRQDGSTVETESISVPLQFPEGPVNLILARDISDRRRMEALQGARLTLSEFSLSHDLPALLKRTLELLLDLTGSETGFLHGVETDPVNPTLQVWATRTPSDTCSQEGLEEHPPTDQAGVWAKALRQGSPVIHNSGPSFLPGKDIQEEAAPMHREMVAPLLRGGKTVALFGVRNKPTPYSPRDLELAEQVANLAWDIIEGKRKEEALEESEARFRTLFHTHNAPFLLLDPADGAIVDANPSAARYYGYSPQELTTLHIQDLNVLSPEEVARERRKALRGDQNHFIFPHRRKDGEIRTVEVHSSPVRLASRTLLFSIVHDISDRVVVEDALRQSERRFRLLLDASHDAIFLHGFQENGRPGTFVEVSRAACEWLGYTRAELLVLTPEGLLALEERLTLPGLAHRLRQQGNLVFSQKFITKDGRIMQVELSSQVVEVDNRMMVLTIARDISERNRAQALATATESILAKGRMAAYVAHEINSPLAGIKNAFQLVSNSIPASHPHYRYVGLIHQEITRISTIVKSMYELYKPTSQLPTDLLLETVIQEVFTLLAPKVRAHQVDLRLEMPDPTLRATLPSDLLRQVLFNLLQNALEASPIKGVVSCHALRQGDRLCILVADEGRGIPPEVAPRVFEPGFSTKHATGTQMGLGLGLGSSRKLTEGMGGALTFANNPENKGCTFRLDLPLILHSLPPE